MKAVMVEFLNDDNSWEWFKVSLKQTPKEAIIDYLEEHDLDFDKKEIKSNDCTLYYNDEVRAYYINIEE